MINSTSLRLVLAVFFFVLLAGGSLQSASAAEGNQNEARSNKSRGGIRADDGSGGGGSGGSAGDAIIENMRTRINELEERLKNLGILSAQVDQELAAIDALQQEISSLSVQARDAAEAEAAAAEDLSAQYEEATRVFNEQVAPVLDPAVAQAVLAALDGASKEAGRMRSSGGVTVASGDVNGDGLDSSVSEALDEIREAAADLKKVVEKATSGLKDTLKTQV
ncbi:hypothetical protein IT575_01820 [bacterium]|nr:hypothetical protein [bacterium]